MPSDHPLIKMVTTVKHLAEIGYIATNTSVTAVCPQVKCTFFRSSLNLLTRNALTTK
jgi:hypothetical protein